LLQWNAGLRSLVFSARKSLLPSDQIRTNQIRTWWQ
jgi:hypothetical protein